MHFTDRQQIIQQASDWLIRLQEGDLSIEEQLELEHWSQLTPTHKMVWDKALELEEKFSNVSAETLRPVMSKVNQSQLSQSKKFLWLLAVLPIFAGLYLSNEQQQWLADYRSSVGERKTIELPDGGKITLNASSAIDVEYTASERTIILRKGEVWIETHKDDLNRPFIVFTKHGQAQALGTKYLVNMTKYYSWVAVSQGQVKVMVDDQYKVLNPNQQTYFDQHQIQQSSQFDGTEMAWTKGFLMIHDLPLKDFISRLKPYQKGVIYLDRSIESMRISGTYPIDDLSKTYQMLEQTYGLEVNSSAAGYLTSLKKSKPD